MKLTLMSQSNFKNSVNFWSPLQDQINQSTQHTMNEHINLPILIVIAHWQIKTYNAFKIYTGQNQKTT